MAFRGFASVALTAALVISHPLRGQGGLDSSAAAVSSSTPLHLSVVATGPAEGLQRADVHLLDNGTPATIQSFQPLNAQKQPAHVILVIDDVNARLTTVAYERDQLKKYFARNEGKLSVPLSLAVMTDQTTQIQPGFSQSGTQENDALQKYEIGLHEIRRDAQYGGFDRTSIGIRALTQLVQYAARIPGHKLILFVSPGWPLLSGPRVYLTNKEQNGILAQVAQLQDVMLRADITLDMINPFGPAESPLRSDYYQEFLKGVRKPSEVDIADLSLQVLVSHSGGTVQQGNSDITGMVDRSISDLNRTYTLAFLPGHGGEGAAAYHNLKLTVDRPGVTARAPDEYYEQNPAATDAPR